jgi:hypothetical protein
VSTLANSINNMDSASISEFEKTVSQLDGIYAEISALSKKSPNDSLNKFKIKFVNVILKKAAEVMGDELLPLEDFHEFEEDNLPSNSDVCFIVAQYMECLEQLRSENIYKKYNSWYWIAEDDDTLHTGPPRKILKK